MSAPKNSNSCLQTEPNSCSFLGIAMLSPPWCCCGKGLQMHFLWEQRDRIHWGKNCIRASVPGVLFHSWPPSQELPLCCQFTNYKNKWPFGGMLGSLCLYISWVKTLNIWNSNFQCWQFLFQFYLKNIALKGHMEKERRKDGGGLLPSLHISLLPFSPLSHSLWDSTSFCLASGNDRIIVRKTDAT